MSFLSQTIMKTYKLILVVLLAACATVPQRPEISGATYDRFHCNYKQAEAGWAKQGNFDLGDPVCEVIGYYGDPEYVGESHAVYGSLLDLRWQAGRVQYLFEQKGDGPWLVTSKNIIEGE